MSFPSPTPADESGAFAAIASRLIAREGGEGRTSKDVAASAAQACEKLCTHLGRIVGRQGIRALFDRSLFLTRKRFPWLTSDALASQDAPWETLRSCLEAQPADAALDASVCLVAHVVRLLGGLIGDALMLHLLSEVWPEDLPPGTSEVMP